MTSFVYKHINLVASLIVGLATISTAYASYAGGLWGGASSSFYTKSVFELSEANTSYLEQGQDGLTEEEFAAAGQHYEESWNKARLFMEQADEANSTGDRYLLSTVILAMVMFFASMSLLFTSKQTQIASLALSIVMIVVSLTNLLLIPQPWKIPNEESVTQLSVKPQ